MSILRTSVHPDRSGAFFLDRVPILRTSPVHLDRLLSGSIKAVEKQGGQEPKRWIFSRSACTLPGAARLVGIRPGGQVAL